MKNGKLVRFDWAIKYLLRNKANFDVLEGFLSAVLNRSVKVLNLLESESNKQDKGDKLNRVDLLVKADNEELILVEVQVESEVDFFHRITYGTAKLINYLFQPGTRERLSLLWLDKFCGCPHRRYVDAIPKPEKDIWR